MRNKLPLLLFLTVMSWQLIAQEQQLLLRKDVRKQNERNLPSWGPNTKNFWANYYAYGLVLPINKNDSLAIRENQFSNILSYGWRYKRKVSELFSFGTDMLWKRHQYSIKQHDFINILSPGVKNDRQKLIFNSVAFGGYIRLNPAKRGNKLGKYLDIGAEGHWVFYNRLLTINRSDPALSGGATKTKVSSSGLEYVKPMQTFALIRIGWERLAIFGNYRLQNPFQRTGNFYNNQNIPELPFLSFGLEFTFWNVPYSTVE